MRLKHLFEGIPIEMYRGSKDLEIKGICIHSKKVSPGDLFISLNKDLELGLAQIQEAVQSGAAAILAPHGNPFLKQVVQLIYPNPEEIVGKLCALFYQYPNERLFKIGVTGTCGKTTTTYLIKHLFDELSLSCGLIGSVEYILGDSVYTADRTTPDVLTNHRLLKEMVKKNLSAVAMEVSSHGLVQGRVDEIAFDVGLYTNLSVDHLDYHKTMEEYAKAKSLLFKKLQESAVAVVWNECPWKKAVLADASCRILTYGFSPESNLWIKEIKLLPSKTAFTLRYEEKDYFFESSLVGRHNILNCAAALGAVISQGNSLSSLIGPLKNFKGVPGRLERVKGSNVFVDYAHKPDALEKVLMALREVTKGKLITVFGCGGDRDRTKRPLMAQVAEKFSDQIIVTSDNPRSENPSDIIGEIVQGFKGKNYTIVEDRKRAIGEAIAQSHKEDLILIAGKGHETYQIFAHQTISFDDKKVAEEFLDLRAGT